MYGLMVQHHIQMDGWISRWTDRSSVQMSQMDGQMDTIGHWLFGVDSKMTPKCEMESLGKYKEPFRNESVLKKITPKQKLQIKSSPEKTASSKYCFNLKECT
jgi:hypothetical protein